MSVSLSVGVENVVCEADHRSAVGSQREVAGVAAEQFAADGLLQTGDVSADRRLPQPENATGRSETAGALDGEESAQEFGVQHIHHDIRSYISDTSPFVMYGESSTFVR